MSDDPNFDGASLLVVGEHVLAAVRERPALGLALARERTMPSDPGRWYIGTRVARAPQATRSDVRFEGNAPPLRALAERIEVGEFGTWFGDLKADADAGRVHPIKTGARASGPSPTIALAPPPPSAPAPEASDTPPAPEVEIVFMQRYEFPKTRSVPAVRARGGRS